MTERPFSDFAEWREDAFHAIEVQACGETKTIQFGFVDRSGDFFGNASLTDEEGLGDTPGPIALSLDDAETMAKRILEWVQKCRGTDG